MGARTIISLKKEETAALIERVKTLLCEHGYRVFNLSSRRVRRHGDCLLVLRQDATKKEEVAKAILLQVTDVGRVSIRPFGGVTHTASLKIFFAQFKGLEHLYHGVPVPLSAPRWWEMMTETHRKEWKRHYGSTYGSSA